MSSVAPHPLWAMLEPAMLFAALSLIGLCIIAIMLFRKNQQLQNDVRRMSVEHAAELARATFSSEDRGELIERLRSAEEANTRADQQIKEWKARMQDWDVQRAQMLQAAQSAVLKTSNELSSKLLADHKREAEASRTENEQRVYKATEDLMKQFQEISNSVAVLQERTQMDHHQMQTVMRALTHPGGAGRMAEVGLENALKKLGLEAGRDFIMQYHIKGEDSNMRPDAIVFLPQDMVMVIDSKASKFLIELAEAEVNTPEEAGMIAEKLKRSMQEHIRTLGQKQYHQALQRMCKNSQPEGSQGSIGHILNIMYVPAESLIERLRALDTDLDDRLAKSNLILAGPASIAGLFALARENIATARRSENEQKIIHASMELMDNVAIMLGHVDKVGNGVKTASDALDRVARSVNRKILPKMRQLNQLGLEGNKTIPPAIASYEVRKIEHMLELAADDVEDTKVNSKEPTALLEEASA